MTYCFDNSAINELHDDPDRDAIAEGLLATNRVYVTALNVIEACGTADRERRLSLVKLLKRLAGEFFPLAVPNELLQRTARAYAEGQSSLTITIGEEQKGPWIALNDPERVDEQARQKVFQWKERLEKPFKAAHRTARPHFQQLFSSGSTTRPRSASALIKHYWNDEEFLYEVMAPLYQRASGKELQRDKLRQFFADVPHWSLYFAGWAYAIFERAIRKEKYGPRRKAGTVDLWSAIYLPHCDCFVTHDTAQRRTLRLLNVLNYRRTKILSYTEFRRRLLVE